MVVFFFFFFFQAEDGIRDWSVTGVQTCALPICDPTARVTGRPLPAISSASWAPDADAPTTSTPPSGRSAALRNVAAVCCTSRGSRADAGAGTNGSSHQPVATTTEPAIQRPAVVD